MGGNHDDSFRIRLGSDFFADFLDLGVRWMRRVVHHVRL